MNKDLEKYISTRYARWLDYSLYHCTHAGMADEATDVLNEVLCNLLQKPESKLLALYNAKKNGYTELDFFVLRMIKFNATSDTAPYRAKYKPIPTDENVDFSSLETAEILDDDRDKTAEILENVRQVREVYESLQLSEKAKQIFEFRFFQHENFKDWTGQESLSELYDTYNKVVNLIKEKIKGKIIF